MKKFFQKIFGRKYYFVVARDRFRLSEFCVGHIFGGLNAAIRFCDGLQYNTMSNVGLEVHSFRSRKSLTTYEETVKAEA